MKKFLSVFFAVAVIGVIAAPIATKAVTSTSTVQDLIATLNAQIATLKAQLDSLNAQIEALNKAKTEVKQTTQDVKSTLQLIRNLKEGSEGDDVKTLQELLSTDKSIYPEGLITGYFGKATAKAVKKLQKKLCIDQVGQVGPQTMRRINELLEEGAGESGEHSNNAEDSKHVPKGLLTAPGILKKLCGTSTPATTTPDITAPTISDIKADHITQTTARIEWETNEKANGKVWYGTANPVVTATPTLMVSSDSFVKDHSLTLTGLAANTTYYYVVVSADAAGNTTTSAQKSFTTLAAPDTTAPVISNVIATGTTATATQIQWATNELATSKVWYGTSTPVITAAPTLTVSSSLLTLNHVLNLTGLTPTTTYYYVVVSADALNNTATATQQSFTTLGQ